VKKSKRTGFFESNTYQLVHYDEYYTVKYRR